MRTVSCIFMAATLLTTTLATAQAGDFSYNYLEGNIIHDAGESILNTSGEIKASASINDHINVVGSYEFAEDEIYGRTINYSQTKLGLGLQSSMSPTVDAFTEISALMVKAKLDDRWDASVEDASGYAVAAGVRAHLNDRLEANAQIDFAKAKFDHYWQEDVTETSLTVGGRFKLTETVSLGAGLKKYDASNSNVVTGGLRVSTY